MRAACGWLIDPMRAAAGGSWVEMGDLLGSDGWFEREETLFPSKVGLVAEGVKPV
jgi:hypothetical protein